MWLFAILLVLVLGGIAAVAAGRGDPLADEHADRLDTLVPTDGPVCAADLRRVRFPLVLRGYRMSDVDALLDRLAVQLEEVPDPPEPTDSSRPVVPDHPAGGTA